MIALSIAYSFLASAYVLPTFLILWAKWRNNYRAKKGIEEKIIEDEEVKEEHDEEKENALEEESIDDGPNEEELEEDKIKVKVKD